MATNKSIFDNWLKQKVMSASEPDVPLSWDQLASALDKEDKKKAGILWFYRIAGSVLLLTILISSIFILNREAKSDENLRTPIGINTTKEESLSIKVDTIEKKENTINTSVGERVDNSNENGSLLENHIQDTRYVDNIGLGQDRILHNTKNIESRKYNAIQSLAFKTLSSFPIGNTMNLPTKRNYKRILTPTSQANLWELGFSVSPSLGATLIKSDAENGWRVNDRFKGINNNSVFAALSNQVKFDVNRYINEKRNWYIGAGLSYIQRQEQVRYSHIIDRVIQLDLTRKEIDDSQLRPRFLWEEVNHTGSNTYQFLQIPIHIGNSISIRSDIKLRTEIGLNYTYTLGVSGTKISPTYLTLSKVENLSRHNLMGGIKSGLYYDYKNRFEFGFTPFYQQMFTGLSSGANGIVENTSLYGVNFNIIYKLGSF